MWIDNEYTKIQVYLVWLFIYMRRTFIVRWFSMFVAFLTFRLLCPTMVHPIIWNVDFLCFLSLWLFDLYASNCSRKFSSEKKNNNNNTVYHSNQKPKTLFMIRAFIRLFVSKFENCNFIEYRFWSFFGLTLKTFPFSLVFRFHIQLTCR